MTTTRLYITSSRSSL